MRPPWPRVKLGEVCEICPGTRVRRKDSQGGEYPVYGGGGATFTWPDYNREDQLIVSRFAMSEECVRFVKGRFFLNDSGLSVASSDKRLSQAYLDWCLYGKQPEIYALGRGAAQKNLDMEQFPLLEISLPPLPVQREIVARLERELGAVDKLAKKFEELEIAAEAEFKAELKETFERFEGFEKFEGLGGDEMVVRSVPDRRNRMTTKNALCDGCGGEGTRRPTAVRWVKLGEVCSKIGSGATPLGGKKTYCDDGVGLIRSQNVLDLSFSFKGLAHINDEQADRLKSVTVLAQDVLLNITGDSVARACVVDDNALPARVNQHVAIIRVENSKILLPRFLELWLISYKPKLLEESQKGSTRKALTKDYLFDLAIPLPPLSAQRTIVARLDAAKAKKEAVVAAAKCGKETAALWRKAILKEAFE